MRITMLPLNRRIIRLIYLMILFFMAFSPSVKSQTMLFEKFGVEEGLSSSKVY
jgi:hypothetical protein